MEVLRTIVLEKGFKKKMMVQNKIILVVPTSSKTIKLCANFYTPNSRQSYLFNKLNIFSLNSAWLNPT